jgi:cellulose synthase/poly-beta-1,6-N-acetylglucosamine synthase-like glycosyltransferase
MIFWVLLLTYYAAAAFLTLLALYRLVLTLMYLWRRPAPVQTAMDTWPRVTVQLPVYNEAAVIERLIDAACNIEYPAGCIEIQVIDDSTDAAEALAEARVAHWKALGHDIAHVRRVDRSGFKAGALENATESATGEFLAIFDADFVPDPQFLRRVVPCFSDARVGMVQTRWGHLNRRSSWLTRAQAVLLEGHFVVEQSARAHHRRFMNFNGTAGVWRRSTIEDAGGWSHDTLTEDLDLSYRAQLRGWRFVYLEDVESPAEIPPDVASFKSQQHRWAKGSIECLVKLWRDVLTADRPWWIRLEGLMHLSANLGYVAVMAMVLVLPVVASLRAEHDLPGSSTMDLALLAVGMTSLLSFYWVSLRRTGFLWWQRIPAALWAMLIDIGMSLHKSRAVIEALARVRTPFIRTPKQGAVDGETHVPGPYRNRRLADGVPELLVSIWCLGGSAWLLSNPWQSPVPIVFLAFFALAFGYIGLLAFWESRPRSNLTPA